MSPGGPLPRSSRRGGSPRGTAVALALVACLAAGCRSSTLRLPGPLLAPKGEHGPAPGPAQPGVTRVAVLRIADGVRVRRPGAPADFPLTYARKLELLAAGGGVRTTGTGRAILTWDHGPRKPADADAGAAPLSGTRANLPEDERIMLYGVCLLQVGDPDRGEPLVRFQEIDSARVWLGSGESVALPGGALLVGDPDGPSGPFHLVGGTDGTVRLSNGSPEAVNLRLADATVEVRGGAVLDVPASPGWSPRPAPAEAEAVVAAGLPLAVRGDLQCTTDGGAALVQARGEGEVRGLGVTVHLNAGESARLSPLGGGAAPTAAQPPAPAAPESAPPASPEGTDAPPAGDRERDETER